MRDTSTPPATGVRTWLAVACLLLVMAALDIASLQHLSVTYDEPRHFQYGLNILEHDSTRFDDSKMPLSALNALPHWIAARLPTGPLATAMARLETGRYVTVLVALLVGLCVFAWARELYGASAGLLSLALYVFDPNILAHAQLVTTDLYAAGTVALAVYTFWRALMRDGHWPLIVLSGLTLGLAQIAKYTALALIPLLVVIAVGFHASALRSAYETRRWDVLRRWSGQAVQRALVMLVLTTCVVNAGFLFNRTGTPLAGYAFRSDLFRQVQSAAGPLARVPLPLPYPYLEGLDWVVQRERTGEGYGPIYMNGEIRQGSGFAGYYLYATLLKVPLGTQLVLLGAAAAYLRRRGRFAFLKHEWALLVPLAFFTLYFNFFYRAQIGIRYFLVVYPLLYVLAGSLLAAPVRLPTLGRTALGVALVWVVVSVASYYPYFLPYFNELLTDRRLAYRYLADSNVDWGQHGPAFARYMQTHPDAVVEPERPVAGTVLVGVNVLTGVGGQPERFRWLREHFTPVDHVAHAVLVYWVTPEDLARLGGR